MILQNSLRTLYKASMCSSSPDTKDTRMPFNILYVVLLCSCILVLFHVALLLLICSGLRPPVVLQVIIFVNQH